MIKATLPWCSSGMDNHNPGSCRMRAKNVLILWGGVAHLFCGASLQELAVALSHTDDADAGGMNTDRKRVIRAWVFGLGEMRFKKEKAGAENRPREAFALDAGRDSLLAGYAASPVPRTS